MAPFRSNLRLLLLSLLIAAPALRAAVEHPFLLWTREEAAELRKRIETDSDAKEQYQRMKARFSATGKGRDGNPTLQNLFDYLVMGDQAAGEREKQNLLQFIGTVPEPLTAEFKQKIATLVEQAGGDPDKIWQRGNASFADRHMRDEQTLNTLRYDVLHDLLAPEQRAGVQTALRAYIQFHLDGHKPWHPDFRYGKQSWLPNMSWPRTIGTHLMAVALRDEALVKAMFESEGGWKWYFDRYVSDRHFYNEEFGKYYSNTGTMILYCEALERLGWGRYGYGYRGEGGADMLSYLKMYPMIGYPRTVIPGGLNDYRRVTMGDAHEADGVMEHSVVVGALPGRPSEERWFTENRMNGPLPKFGPRLWFEAGARRFPGEGFDYFLAQMREPGEDRYLPSLVFGLRPISPVAVKPPPAPSYLAYERQFAFLRAEESPAYWEGPAPAVALQFAGYYAHYAHDAFALLGFQAFNRPIYMNPAPPAALARKAPDHYVNAQIRSAPPVGYISRHPWLDTLRGDSGVVVDFLQARPVETGEEGLKNHALRLFLTPDFKFVSGRAKNVYPDVEQERALVLTREYLFDLFWLRSDRPRIYDWNIQATGWPVFDGDWKPTSELNGSMLYREPGAAQPEGYAEKLDAHDLRAVHRNDVGGTAWSHTILQRNGLAPGSAALMKPEWYERGVGIRVSLLPEDGTIAYSGMTPFHSPEWGGVTLFARRTTPATAFIALHEPFEGGKAPATRFTRLAQSDHAVAARVVGEKLNDLILLGFGPDGANTHTLTGDDGQIFVFTNHAFLCIRGDRVEATGKLSALRLKLPAPAKLFVGGSEVTARYQDGFLAWEK